MLFQKNSESWPLSIFAKENNSAFKNSKKYFKFYQNYDKLNSMNFVVEILSYNF